MQTLTISFSYKFYSFNGCVVEADGYGSVTKNETNALFSEETMISLVGLGEKIRPIYMRLLAEVYNAPIRRTKDKQTI